MFYIIGLAGKFKIKNVGHTALEIPADFFFGFILNNFTDLVLHSQ